MGLLLQDVHLQSVHRFRAARRHAAICKKDFEMQRLQQQLDQALWDLHAWEAWYYRSSSSRCFARHVSFVDAEVGQASEDCAQIPSASEIPCAVQFSPSEILTKYNALLDDVGSCQESEDCLLVPDAVEVPCVAPVSVSMQKQEIDRMEHVLAGLLHEPVFDDLAGNGGFGDGDDTSSGPLAADDDSSLSRDVAEQAWRDFARSEYRLIEVDVIRVSNLLLLCLDTLSGCSPWPLADCVAFIDGQRSTFCQEFVGALAQCRQIGCPDSVMDEFAESSSRTIAAKLAEVVEALVGEGASEFSAGVASPRLTECIAEVDDELSGMSCEDRVLFQKARKLELSVLKDILRGASLPQEGDHSVLLKRILQSYRARRPLENILEEEDYAGSVMTLIPWDVDDPACGAFDEVAPGHFRRRRA